MLSVLSRNFKPKLKSDWACAEFTWSLSKLNCFCFNLAKSCTCLNLAMVSADNPRPLVFSPVLPPSPLSGRPIFSPSANNISWLYAIMILSFCFHFSFFCVQFSQKYFLDFSFLSWPHFLITPIQSPWNFLFCFLLSHFLVNTRFILFFRNVSSPFLF